jgi:hypothetical protein
MDKFEVKVEVPVALTLKVELTEFGVSVKLVDANGGESPDMGCTNSSNRKRAQQVAWAKDQISYMLPPSVIEQFEREVEKQ